MSRNKWNLIIDLLAYLAMLGLVATATILWKILPPGTGGRHGGGGGALTLLGRTRHEWGDVHFICAVALIALVILHILLHWKWVTNTFGALLVAGKPRRPGAGIGGALLLLALGLAAAAAFAAPWLINVQGREDAGEPGGRGRRGGRGAGLTNGGPTAELDPSAGGSPCEGCAADCPSATATEPAPPKGDLAAHDGGITGRTTLAEAARLAGVAVPRLLAELKLPAGSPAEEQLGRLRRQHGFSIQDVRDAVARLRKPASAD